MYFITKKTELNVINNKQLMHLKSLFNNIQELKIIYLTHNNV